jgi:hypothetical protein
MAKKTQASASGKLLTDLIRAKCTPDEFVHRMEQITFAKRETFIRLFRYVSVGCDILNKLIDIHAVSPFTLEWRTKTSLDYQYDQKNKTYAVSSLYGVLLFLLNEEFFIQKIKRRDIPEIGLEIFGVQPAPSTLDSAGKDRSRIESRKDKGNKTVNNILKEIGLKK